MCRFAWLDFRWETASLEAVVRRQDRALLLRRERAEARLWVYHGQCRNQHSDRYAIRTRNLQSDALPLRQSVEGEAGSGGAAAAISTRSLKVTDLRSAVVADAVVGAGRLSRRSWAACVEFLVGGRQRIDGVSSQPCVRGDALSQGQFCIERAPSGPLRDRARALAAAICRVENDC